MTLPRRFFAPDPSRPFIANGLNLTLYLPANSNFIGPEVVAGTYEPETVRLLQELLHPGMVMVDLGAHIGYFSLIAAKWVGPSGQVYAFEPQPKLFDLLVRNIEANAFRNFVRPINKAVSNAKGPRTLLLSEKDDGEASFYHTPGVTPSRTAIVETTTLDGFFAAEGWPPVHVMKADIGGSEKAALEGMRELSNRNSQLKLIIELCPSSQTAAGFRPEEMVEVLHALGFKKFSAIQTRLRTLIIPRDIQRLVVKFKYGHVNLLCEKG